MIYSNPTKFNVFRIKTIGARISDMKKKKQKKLASAVDSVQVVQTADILADLGKIVPKFCTQIQIGVLNNKTVLLTILFAEPGGKPILIERVMIDTEHAKQLSKVLADAIEKAEK